MFTGLPAGANVKLTVSAWNSSGESPSLRPDHGNRAVSYIRELDSINLEFEAVARFRVGANALRAI